MICCGLGEEEANSEASLRSNANSRVKQEYHIDLCGRLHIIVGGPANRPPLTEGLKNALGT